ncbi:hypothetical protein [Actinospongicola halichondriae]|uniref:hypothetical protein n=1 Tax=Actinospongicola halichondriae TaxID=3236844 RepID=UPI003D3776A3
MAIAGTPAVSTRHFDVRWITRAPVDVLVAFAWVPIWLVAHAVRADTDAVAALAGWVLLISFAHQPVTLPLIYGDVRERRRRTRLLVAAPVVAVVAAFVGLTISVLVTALAAAAWNGHHTLRQRYGILRVYGRKVGQTDGDHEQGILFWWFGAAVAVVFADPGAPDKLQALPLGRVNTQIIDLLAMLRPIAVVVALVTIVGASITTWRWASLERTRDRLNPAKYLYLFGAFGLFAMAPVDPVATVLGFALAHSIEYFVVVHGTVRRRATAGSLLERVVRPRFGPALFLTIYTGMVLALVAGLKTGLSRNLFGAIYLGFGALHFAYDGLIWKLRSPAVAQQFDVVPGLSSD